MPLPPKVVRRGPPGSPPPYFSEQLWQNAAILVDKPSGWTSFDVCGKLRGVLRMRKVGHSMLPENDGCSLNAFTSLFGPKIGAFLSL